MNDLGKLREMTANDLDMVRAWRNAPEVASNMYTRHLISADEHSAWWAAVANRDDQAHFIYQVDGVASGVVNLKQINLLDSNCFLGIYAAPDAPRGTGSCILYLAVRHVFDTLELNKFCCEVLGFNQRAIALYSRFGFLEEGVFRQQHRVQGQWVDAIRFGLLKSDWKAIEGRVEASLRAARE